MATVRSSSLSRAFHTLPKPPTPSRSISSKRPSFVSDGAIRVALLWSTRLKWLPQALQVRSVSAVSTATSVGAWQFGQRTSSRPELERLRRERVADSVMRRLRIGRGRGIGVRTSSLHRAPPIAYTAHSHAIWSSAPQRMRQ